MHETPSKSIEPHVFESIDMMAISAPFSPLGVPGIVTPTKLNTGESRICGICKLPRSDKVHADGEAAADSESPNWG